jgi:hypothetical protein
MCCLTTEQLKCPEILPITSRFVPESGWIGIPTAPVARHPAGNPAGGVTVELSLESVGMVRLKPDSHGPAEAGLAWSG